MAQTKSIDKVVEKWKRVTPGRVEDYVSGVQNPRTSWEQATANSETTYKAAVTAAANAGRFAKGVRKAGNEKWQTNTIVKGQDRWGAGVAIADAAYANGMAPVLRAIESVTLPPRFPAGDARNYDRSKAIGLVLHKLKTGGT